MVTTMIRVPLNDLSALTALAETCTQEDIPVVVKLRRGIRNASEKAEVIDRVYALNGGEEVDERRIQNCRALWTDEDVRLMSVTPKDGVTQLSTGLIAQKLLKVIDRRGSLAIARFRSLDGKQDHMRLAGSSEGDPKLGYYFATRGDTY